MTPTLSIIGGSGLYEIEGLTDLVEHDLDTPFGKPRTLCSLELSAAAGLPSWRDMAADISFRPRK